MIGAGGGGEGGDRSHSGSRCCSGVGIQGSHDGEGVVLVDGARWEKVVVDKEQKE